MIDSRLAEALMRAAEAVRGQGGDLKVLDRGGIATVEVDLTASALTAGYELKAVEGYGLRYMRHGSNPGGRLELKFGNNKATDLFAPGMCVKGGFKTVSVKRAARSAIAGKAMFALLSDRQADVSEDLIVSAIGPVDLLGYTLNGAPASFVTVAEDTDPSGANPTGTFDGSGWELLRVMVDGNSNGGNFTTADVVFWQTPTYDGTVWFECGTDGRYAIPDTDTSAQRYRSFTVGWAGRGVGYPAVRNLLAAARTGLGFIIQGLR